MGSVRVTHVDLGDGQRTARVAEVWSEPGIGFCGSMSPSLAMDLGMCGREGGTHRRAGTLTFTPDGAERGVEVEVREVRAGHRPALQMRQCGAEEWGMTFFPHDPETPGELAALMGVTRAGNYTIDRLPDEPKAGAEKHLKCWPEFFASLASGVKTFDIREERDREFRVGDILVMEEYDIETDHYSGQQLAFEVTFCLRRQPWVPLGYVAMGLKGRAVPDAPKPAAARPLGLKVVVGSDYLGFAYLWCPKCQFILATSGVQRRNGVKICPYAGCKVPWGEPISVLDLLRPDSVAEGGE